MAKYRNDIRIGRAAITYSLIAVWVILMAVGMMTLIDPHWLDFLAREEREDIAMNIYESGRDYLESGQTFVAIRQFEDALAIDSLQFDAMLGLGEAYMKLNKQKVARDYFLRSLEGDPLLPHRAHIALGNIYEANGVVDSALYHYHRAVETGMEPTGAYYHLGALYLNLHKPDSAEKYLRKAWENQTSMATQYRGALKFGLVFHRDMPEEQEEIEKLLSDSITRADLEHYDYESFKLSRFYSQEAMAVQHLLGISLAVQGKFEEGEDFILRALEIQPNNQVIRSDLQVLREDKAAKSGR